MPNSSRTHVAVDIGGTFTDICTFDKVDGQVRVAKVPSSPNPIDAVLHGLEQHGVDLGSVALFSHGTTVATNALIERNFRPSAMITTRGFRDVIEIRRGTREDLWDLYADPAEPYIRRRDRLEITERVAADGSVVTELNEDEVQRIVEILRHRKIESVAICLINAYANPVHEERLEALLREQLPDTAIWTSSAILPEIFEHERFSTTTANAVVGPLVTKYVSDLDASLTERGYDGNLLLLHSGGGVMTPQGVRKLPVRLASSGLAAGATACQYIAKLAGFSNAIGLDMGGTSSDISLVNDGELSTTDQWQVEYGYPICLPSIEVLTIGAGGGSIARLDEAGSLRSGPQSAGATPGPACYGAGGTAPTTTDANLALGRLDTKLLGGAMTLDVELARDAIEREIATPLGMTVEQGANAILQVANANMADAVRVVSIRQGFDPRDFALTVFGGAGPLHGASIARALSIPTVIVPPNPGVSSALGCLLVDVRHDLGSLLLARADELDLDVLRARFAELERDAHERLDQEGVAPEDMRFQRSLDMRYQGQWRSLNVPVPSDSDDLEQAIQTFHEEHERSYSFRRDGAPVEIYRANIRATGVVPKPELPWTEPVEQTATPQRERDVYFHERDARVPTPVFDRATLSAGSRIVGPAIIEQIDSTTVVPPDAIATVDGWMNVRIDLQEIR